VGKRKRSYRVGRGRVKNDNSILQTEIEEYYNQLEDMNIQKAIELLTKSGFWEYRSTNEDKYFSNGKRQFTIRNNKLYINEHIIFKRFYTTQDLIKSQKQLKETLKNIS
jgi:hypothetical protein